ncbi:MAG: substrate-binding domain-containing protein [Planctomycetales bacterium]|nr:substrate-binding domain-containing protein [Planctomycetales bacterium]
MVHPPRVALLIETSRGYGRALLRGIVRYARLHGPWEFYITPGDFEQKLPDMTRWGGTGIIARIENARVAKAIIATGLPVVALDISQNIPIDVLAQAQFSEVASDSRGAARLAAEHLISRGVEQFAYVGDAGRAWSQNRELGYVEFLCQRGLEPIVYRPPLRQRDRSWASELPILAEWLAKLPKPIGIMASNDDRGRQVLEACSAAHVHVPRDALVIGVDNDELLCELAPPPLSSVALNAENGGYRTAALLDEMMKGDVASPQRLVVEPLHVVERRSTESRFAMHDPDVAAALDFIQKHAGEPIGVEDVVSRLDISRRMFEIRFRQIVGRTPHQELRRLRLARAQRLLIETNLPLSKIALAAGFCSAAHMSQTFRKALETTPAQYRRSHQT